MNDKHADAGLLTRREVLQRLTALAATSTLAGCQWNVSPFPPPPPAAEIDIHCHIFNVRDMPAFAFILDVAVNTPLLHDMAEPIAKLMVEIVRDCAPDAAEELVVLQMIRANPSTAASIIQNSNFPEIMFIAGFLRFIDRTRSSRRACRPPPRGRRSRSSSSYGCSAPSCPASRSRPR